MFSIKLVIPKTILKNQIWWHSQIKGKFIYYSHLSVKFLLCNKILL